MRELTSILLALIVCGCTSTATTSTTRLPKTLGEIASGYGYIPLDGLAVEETFEDTSCAQWRLYTDIRSPRANASNLVGEQLGTDPFRPLLESLPDISVRFAVGSFDSSGGLTFGPAKITAEGRNYRAILDYVNVDAIPVTFWISAIRNGIRVRPSELGGSEADAYVADIAEPIVMNLRHDGAAETSVTIPTASDQVTIPVYVGIGMRLSADITALESGIPLISLGAIGLEAQAKKLVGTLTVQTIGVSGKAVATSLPLPSNLDQTTIENSILAIGSNRAVVYGNANDGSTITTARVVGIYSPIGTAPALVNAIYSELSRQPPRWPRPCKAVQPAD